jgi:hypothetical protein
MQAATATAAAPAKVSPMIRLTSTRKRKPGQCACDVKPVLVPFSLNGIQGDYCSVCFEVTDWYHRPIDKATKKVKEGFQLPYEIISINAVLNKPDFIELTCRFTCDQGFGIMIKSTPEKVKAAIASPLNLQGKVILLEFTTKNDEGIPQNPKMVKILTRAEMNEFIKTNPF